MRESLPASEFLDVPGARLYYEVQGAGPVLMFVGHPMGADGFAAIAALMAEHYTVVTHDPRGFARSSIEDPDQDAEPELLAEDARRILEAVDGGPARVFGSSGGAVTGLALAARYPGQVRTLVAHEPPLALLLPDADRAKAGLEEIYNTYRTGDIGAAWQKFSTFASQGMPPQGEEPTSPPRSPEAVATSERFFAHALLPVALYQPDFPSLGRAATHVVVAGGTASEGQFARRTAVELADRLGTALVGFPGGHTGFLTDVQEFALALLRALA